MKEQSLPEPHYEKVLRWLQEEIQKAREGKRVIKGKDLRWQQSRQARVKRYAGPFVEDQALDTMWLFVQEVRSHSGRHVHQGGLAIFVLDGKGYTEVDGVKHKWEKGDLILLPIKPGGVEHQHFNQEGKAAHWLAIIPLPLWHMAGRFIEHKADHPDWQAAKTTRGKTAQ